MKNKKLIKKIKDKTLIGITLASAGIGALIYYINPSKGHFREQNPFFYENEIYYIENNLIKKQGKVLEIPADRINDFAIKNNEIYFSDKQDWKSTLRKFNPRLEEITTLSNENEYCIELDIQNNQLLKKVAINDGESIDYFLGEKIIKHLEGEDPVFNGNLVYSLKDKNIFKQKIDYENEKEISLSIAEKLTNSNDYLEFRLDKNNIYSLNGSDYSSCDLYKADINDLKYCQRITYDTIKPISHKKMKKDLIVYEKDNKTFAAFMQGSREKIGKINNIYLGDKNEQ